jgi:hypothetical protein
VATERANVLESFTSATGCAYAKRNGTR